MAKLDKVRKTYLTINGALSTTTNGAVGGDGNDGEKMNGKQHDIAMVDDDAESVLSQLSDDDDDIDVDVDVVDDDDDDDIDSVSSDDDVLFEFGGDVGVGVDGGVDDDEYDSKYNEAPLSMLELMHKRERYMSLVYGKISELEARASTTSSSDYLRGLTEIRELEMILNNGHLKYFYNHFVSVCNQIFNDCSLAQQAILENTAEIGTPLLSNLDGIQMLRGVLASNQRKLTSSSTVEYLETIVNFIQSLPDREVVIMQIARHLALSLPFRSFIVESEHQKERQRERRREIEDLDGAQRERAESEDIEDSNHLIKIDKFITSKIREWMGSILNIYGNSAFSSVRVALEDDVVAQVRPSHAARLIVNCVYGLDVSL